MLASHSVSARPVSTACFIRSHCHGLWMLLWQPDRTGRFVSMSLCLPLSLTLFPCIWELSSDFWRVLLARSRAFRPLHSIKQLIKRSGEREKERLTALPDVDRACEIGQINWIYLATNKCCSLILKDHIKQATACLSDSAIVVWGFASKSVLFSLRAAWQ